MEQTSGSIEVSSARVPSDCVRVIVSHAPQSAGFHAKTSSEMNVLNGCARTDSSTNVFGVVDFLRVVIVMSWVCSVAIQVNCEV